MDDCKPIVENKWLRLRLNKLWHIILQESTCILCPCWTIQPNTAESYLARDLWWNGKIKWWFNIHRPVLRTLMLTYISDFLCHAYHKCWPSPQMGRFNQQRAQQLFSHILHWKVNYSCLALYSILSFWGECPISNCLSYNLYYTEFAYSRVALMDDWMYAYSLGIADNRIVKGILNYPFIRSLTECIFDVNFCVKVFCKTVYCLNKTLQIIS